MHELALDPLGETFAPLSQQEALVESTRCLYCYDAPCTHACPTHIDIPSFIKKIASGNLIGSAATILDSNLLGATCARVCPVQELCEGACVLGAEHRPITIGRLQRYSMDFISDRGVLPIAMAAPSEGKVAVIGAGPVGLSCAGQLARLGHQVTIFEKRELPGGLSTYGIIALREPVVIALEEVEMIKQLGVKVETGRELGKDLDLVTLQAEFDAVFLGCGLGTTPELGIPGEEFVLDGLDYIEQSKLTRNDLVVGRNVVVIGAGNTAIDCATIAKRLGAERVTILYRRTANQMTAYPHEYEFIKNEGVEFRFLTQPVRVMTEGDRVVGLECVRMELGEADSSGRASGRPISSTEHVVETDQIVKAIGQEKPALAVLLNLETESGCIKVSADFETSTPALYAGGDCVRARGSASTVMAVQDGKLAATAIHKRLVSQPEGVGV